ncbi:hypothetical protein GCM10007416_23260 [Kroppenstedtia guangzhouensis]|uniref:Uncharacterized protein n=1 Tax=Kroppenstedtia guangzhouensis TaxID=1274356 RepID=A0ABQ1GU36_9BACL|nr:hypothetical protein GCM10007416_23260 [Kroppenstedtia guangzhouensis]
MDSNRIPVTIFVDDVTPGINLLYQYVAQVEFSEYDSPEITFGPYDELLSQMIPIDLLWKFISLVEEFQIKGKLSLVPCPGGLGRIDREIEGVTSHDLKNFFMLFACSFFHILM